MTNFYLRKSSCYSPTRTESWSSLAPVGDGNSNYSTISVLPINEIWTGYYDAGLFGSFSSLFLYNSIDYLPELST